LDYPVYLRKEAFICAGETEDGSDSCYVSQTLSIDGIYSCYVYGVSNIIKRLLILALSIIESKPSNGYLFLPK
jgi:hypothetical protein